MRLRLILGLFNVFGLAMMAYAQDLSNQKMVTVHREAQSWHSDPDVIIPHSIQTKSFPDYATLNDAFYTVKNDTIFLFWDQINLDSVLLAYRVLPNRIGLTLSHFDTTKIRHGINPDYIGFDIGPIETVSSIDIDGLDYDGSFLRGLSFGNNQSLFLNSAFNLQIAGKIGEDTEILAALTDENIPLQPQGNTQQLNEFDKIFIQIKNKNKTLIAGDYELKQNPNHFLRYFKKLKGGSFQYEAQVKEKYKIKTAVSAAISRGKFARYTITTQEGNQGPYRLVGSEGEQFIVVLAGSERVYYDGQLLKRGIDDDYIIDYNQAEVRFTSKRLITKDSRIIIEFEYTFEIYNRGFYSIHSEIKSDKLKLGAQFYNEQDGTAPTAQFTFTDDQLNILRDAGDDPLQTVASSIRPFNSDNSNNPVTYAMSDTIINGITYPRLIYNTGAGLELFTATFSNVGAGNGNYRQADAEINGQVFEWVAPNPDGTRTGSYLPITNLIAPTKKQVLALNGTYDINKNNTVRADLSLSNNDANKLSLVDDGDNTDIAAFIDYTKKIKISDKWTSDLSGSYELIGKNYNAVNPFRRQEFTRDWNTDQLLNTQAKDQTSQIKIGLRNGDKSNLTYKFSSYNRANLYQGYNHNILISQNFPTLKIKWSSNYLTSDTDTESTSFVRPSLEIIKSFKKIKGLEISFKNNFEKNEIKQSDILSDRSFEFYEQISAINSTKGNGFSWGVSHKYRIDKTALLSQLERATTAHEIQVKSSVKSKKQSLSLIGHYRKLNVDSSFVERFDPQDTYLVKAEHQWKLWSGGVLLTNNYELGSGQEERLDVVFVETLEEGQGQYIHKELTGDNIKQNYEFFLAPFDNQGNFTRVTLGSTDFIRTHNVRFNQSIKVNFNKILKNQKNRYKLLKKLSLNSNLLSSKTNEATSSEIVWNPFSQDLLEGVIIAAENRWKSTLFFNRADPLYQLQYSYTQRQNKNLFTTGFETRELFTQTLDGRLNVNKSWSAECTLSTENRKSDNELFSDRNYDITSQKVEPKLTYLASKHFRIRTSFSYEQSQNKPGNEEANTLNLALNFQVRKSTKSSIQGEMSYNRVQVNDDIDPSLVLDFLRGLTPGNNLIWNLSIDRTLAKNLRLSLVYDGRKLGEGKTVHTGSAQIGATF